jgi:hypothetical protein
LCRAAILAVSIWVLHGLVHGLLAASVAAIASRPLYTRFAARARKHVGKHATAFMFAAIVSVFVLALLVFALWAPARGPRARAADPGADERGLVRSRAREGAVGSARPSPRPWQGRGHASPVPFKRKLVMHDIRSGLHDMRGELTMPSKPIRQALLPFLFLAASELICAGRDRLPSRRTPR